MGGIYYHNEDGSITFEGDNPDTGAILHLYTYDIEEKEDDIFLKTVQELEDLGIYNNVSSDTFKNTDINITSFGTDENNPEITPVEVAEQTSTLIGEMQRKNDILHNQNLLMQQQNTIEYVKTVSSLEKMKIDVAFKLNEARNNEANRKLRAKHINALNTANTLKIEDNTINTQKKQSIDNLVTATENQEITADFSSSSISMNMDGLTEYTESINNLSTQFVQTHNKISEGIEAQKEALDFEKQGNDTLKDSDGKKIIPREVKALKNGEDRILRHAQNRFDNNAFIGEIEKIGDTAESLGLKIDENSDDTLLSILSKFEEINISSIDSLDDSLLFSESEVNDG